MKIINITLISIALIELFVIFYFCLKYLIKAFLFERKRLMPYSLIITDMQLEFSAASNPQTIIAVQETIIQAINDYAEIIVLEFTGCGRTMESIYQLLDSYHKVYFIRKPSCDGSLFIKRINDAFNLQTIHFKVVGVNTNACVRDTVYGLHTRYPESVIEVIENACNCEMDHELGIKFMESISNVVVVRESTKVNVN